MCSEFRVRYPKLRRARATFGDMRSAGIADGNGCTRIRQVHLCRRIMILRLVLPNMLAGVTLQRHAKGCCPQSCPSVEVDADLARIVAAWPRTSPQEKVGLTGFAVF